MTPAEAKEKARALAVGYVPMAEHDLDRTIEHLAKAIEVALLSAQREENERCARIAEEHSDPNPFPTRQGAIAKAIRSTLAGGGNG